MTQETSNGPLRTGLHSTRMSRFALIQAPMALVVRQMQEPLPLARLAAEARCSAAHWHRLFRRATGETPRHYIERLRLSRAAALLLGGADSVRSIARRCGFRSPEILSRNFRRHFGLTPRDYRHRGWATQVTRRQAAAQSNTAQQVVACLHLYRWHEAAEDGSMDYAITERQLAPQSVLMVRRRVERSALAATLGPLYGAIVDFAQRCGAGFAGPPFTRFVESGHGLLTIEAGLPVTAPIAGSGEVQAGTLPGGRTATTTHVGPYDRLPDAYAALERWIESQGLAVAGAPWEVYITDPAETPNPRDWRTDVFWPVAHTATNFAADNSVSPSNR